MLGEVHYVTANARMSVQESKDESYGAHVTGFPNENMDEILFGKEYDEKMTGSENTSRLLVGPEVSGILMLTSTRLISVSVWMVLPNSVKIIVLHLSGLRGFVGM